jgi:hypothetical protein
MKECSDKTGQLSFCFHIFVPGNFHKKIIMGKILYIFLGIILLSGCAKKSSTDNSPYSNSLQFGAGISISDLNALTGITTTFNASAVIYFRLETIDDRSSSAIKIQIDKQDGTSYNTFTYPAAQDNGHIFISYFTIPDPGIYKATGIIATGNITVATQNLTIIATR